MYYSRKNESYKQSPTTNVFNLRCNVMANVIDALVDRDYIKNTPGFNYNVPGKSISARQLRIQAKSRLIDSISSIKNCRIFPALDSDFILLSDDEKQLKTHGRFQRFLGMNTRVKKINQIINSSRITLLNEFIYRYSRRENRLVVDGNYIDLRNTYLYRIFNYNFASGGRFYRGFWQQLSKEQRVSVKGSKAKGSSLPLTFLKDAYGKFCC